MSEAPGALLCSYRFFAFDEHFSHYFSPCCILFSNPPGTVDLQFVIIEYRDPDAPIIFHLPFILSLRITWIIGKFQCHSLASLPLPLSGLRTLRTTSFYNLVSHGTALKFHSSSLILMDRAWKWRIWISRVGRSRKLLRFSIHREFPFTKDKLLKVKDSCLHPAFFLDTTFSDFSYQEVICLSYSWSVTIGETLST